MIDVFVDLRKAFDAVDHSFFVAETGFPCYPWLSCLSNRSQFVSLYINVIVQVSDMFCLQMIILTFCIVVNRQKMMN